MLTRGELAFYQRLCEAVGQELIVFSKVRLADVIHCRRPGGAWGTFSAISQKHLDFVLCDPLSTRIRCAVELDDRSHDAPHRRRRDAFVDKALQAAGVPLVRIRARADYPPAAIAEAVATALHANGHG